MRRIVAIAAATLLILFGATAGVLYAILLLLSADRTTTAESYGSVAGIGGAAAVAGVILLTGVLVGDRRAFRLPFYWLSLIAFAVLVGAGIAGSILDLPPVAAPFLTVAAALMLAIFYAGLLLRWAPGRSQTTRAVTSPMVFGMTGSVLLAVSMQILFVAAIVAGVFIGFTVAGVDIPDSNTIQELMDDFDQGSGSLPETLFTPTVIFIAFALFAVVAPLTEELTKFLGVFIPYFKQVEYSKYTLFLAGAMAGLGFATTENIGYALLSPSAWAPTMLLRAPVVLVHMAASSIVALGWYLQRDTDRLSLVWYFMLAVALHGSFNAVAVAITFLAGSIGPDSNPSAGAALTILLLIGAAGSIISGSLAWLILNARRFGRVAAIQMAYHSESDTFARSGGTESYISSLTGRVVG